MPRILLVADQTDAFEDLAHVLGRETDVDLLWAHDGDAALETVAAASPELVVVDETLGQTNGLEWIRRLITTNAFIQTAAVSRLSEEAFHEASEGLGIMCRLPPRPGPDEATSLLRTLRLYV